MSKNTQLDMLREAAERPPYKQDVYVNAGQLLAEIEREYLPRPRFEDGEPVQFGDKFESSGIVGTVDYILKGNVEGCVIGRKEDIGCVTYPNGKRVKRPEPEVLDADGVPIRKGDTVYATHYCYVECTVLSIEWVCDGWLVEVENCAGHKFRQTPDELTHKEPDSLERIESDAKKLLSGVYKDEVLDLLRRQREVLERGR